MAIIDRYILKKFLTTFVFVVMLCVLIIVVIDITEKIENFSQANLSFMQVLGFYLDYIPWLANTITPITVFIAAVFVTAKMASHTEIVAILSNGISFRRMLVPYLVGASIIGGTSFYFLGWVIPDSTKDRVDFEIKYLKSQYYFSERDNHFNEGPGLFAYVRNYTNTTNTGFNFTLEKFEEEKMVAKLTANSIKWMEDSQSWKIQDWQLREITEDGESLSFGMEMDTVLRLHPNDFSSDYRLQEALTIPELDAKINDLITRGLDGYEVYRIEKYMRIAYPFTVIILTFIAVVISSKKSRRGTGFQIGVGFVIAFIFIIYFIMSKSMAEGGTLPPLLAIWLPNLTFTGIGLFLYKIAPR